MIHVYKECMYNYNRNLINNTFTYIRCLFKYTKQTVTKQCYYSYQLCETLNIYLFYLYYTINIIAS